MGPEVEAECFRGDLLQRWGVICLETLLGRFSVTIYCKILRCIALEEYDLE